MQAQYLKGEPASVNCIPLKPSLQQAPSMTFQKIVNKWLLMLAHQASVTRYMSPHVRYLVRLLSAQCMAALLEHTVPIGDS